MSEKVKKDLTTQGLVVRHAWDLTLTSTKSIWCTVQKYMPKNIFNFTIRYLNNTLSNMSNMHIWGYSENKLCVLCHQVQTLGHVVAGCNQGPRSTIKVGGGGLALRRINAFKRKNENNKTKFIICFYITRYSFSISYI